MNTHTNEDIKYELSLIFPVHNEGNIVEDVIHTLFKTIHRRFEIIAVYDKEEDITIPVLQKLQSQYPALHSVQNKEGCGVLGAFRTGLDEAKSPVVGIWCAYHTDPQGSLNMMMDLMDEGYDLVSGNRYAYKMQRTRGPRMKFFLSITGNFIFSKLLNIPLFDMSTSIKLFRTSVLKSIKIETPPKGGWAFVFELVVKIAINKLRMGEIKLDPSSLQFAGVTNFKIQRYLPYYLYWTWYGFCHLRCFKSIFKQ
ncbi:MAG: glycosyltransferase family 2 protein [bacterium]